MTISVTADNAAHFLRELHTLGFIRAIDVAKPPISLPELLIKQGVDLTQKMPLLNTDGEVLGSVGPISESAPAPTQETTEQKRKRRGKVEMEAARVFEKYVTEHGDDAGKALLAEYGIDDVADIGPDRAAALATAIEEAKKPVETAQTQAEPEEDLMGDLGETTTEAKPPVEPWMLFGADGLRYDAYPSAEEWCDSLAALISSADTVAEIRALATANAGIKDRMEAAGKIDLLRGVNEGGRARMAELDAKPAGDAPTVQDCAAALRAYLDPNRTSKLTSDERTSKACEILKVQFDAPKVASLKPEQFVAFIAALAEAGAE